MPARVLLLRGSGPLAQQSRSKNSAWTSGSQSMTGPEPTGYCLMCGAALGPWLRWCSDICMAEWEWQGAAYATYTGGGVCVQETDSEGRPTVAWSVEL